MAWTFYDDTYQYNRIHINTYQYILIHANTKQYVLSYLAIFRTCCCNTYQYQQIHTNTSTIYTYTCSNMLIQINTKQVHSIFRVFVYHYDSHMMGCPASFLVSRVASLLKKIGTGETSRVFLSPTPTRSWTGCLRLSQTVRVLTESLARSSSGRTRPAAND